jgi:hypothetical protein
MPVVSELRAGIAEADRKATEAKAEISAHERECALRYAGLDAALTDIKSTLAQDREALAAERSKLGTIVWSMIGSVALLAAGIIGWLFVQLYTLEPLRVQSSVRTVVEQTTSAPPK